MFHGNIFIVHFSSFTLFSNHNSKFYLTFIALNLYQKANSKTQLADSVSKFRNQGIISAISTKLFPRMSFKFGVHIRIHSENILLSKMTLNSHFYKTYSDLNLQKCLFDTLPENISQLFTFFISVHISLGVNSETLFKVTLNLRFYKS